jgi:lysophospholipase L1-like esterase
MSINFGWPKTWSGKLFCLSIIFTACIANAVVLIPANDPNINYYGRFDFSNTAKPTCKWPGATIEASFPGPSIGAEISDGGGYIEVEIDGVVSTTWAPQATTNRTISTTLSAGNHTVRLILRSEYAWVTFSGFYIADGKQLNALAKPSRKIEIIGDSWSDGYLVLTTSACANWDDKAQTNANQSWGRDLSKAFHAQDMMVATSGVGLVSSIGGAANMMTRYPQAMMDAAGNWDFSRFTADLVIIFLGINDWSTQGKAAASASQYSTGYHTFIGTIRSHYPNSKILVMGYSNWAVTPATIAAAETNVSSINCPISGGAGCWAHPTVADAKTIANGLIPKVKSMMGWDTTSSTVAMPALRSGTTSFLRIKSSITDSKNLIISATSKDMRSAVQIQSLDGRKIGAKEFDHAGSFTWNTSNVSPGVYFIGNKNIGWITALVK